MKPKKQVSFSNAHDAMDNYEEDNKYGGGQQKYNGNASNGPNSHYSKFQ